MRSIYTCTTGMSAEPFMRSILSQRILTSLPDSRLRFFYRDANSVPTSTPFFYSSINRLYTQNPMFEIVREESVKVYLHLHNGNVQQNPPCVESCVTKEISISPQLSPTMFDPDANSVLLRAHLCTAVDFMCRKPCVRNCSRERKGLEYTTTGMSYLLHTFAQQLYAQNPVFEIVHDESVKVYLHIHVQRECSAEPSMRRILLCSKADSYAYEKLIRKWTKSVFFGFFDLMGTRMVQIRMAKSV